MPYIKNELRAKVDPKINALLKDINDEFDDELLDGLANYVITRIVLGIFMPARERRYRLIARVMAALECAKLEIYRRVAGPYEDQCIANNGDLWELK